MNRLAWTGIATVACHPHDSLGDVLPGHQCGSHQRLHAELR
jgi:hypothetical protein